MRARVSLKSCLTLMMVTKKPLRVRTEEGQIILLITSNIINKMRTEIRKPIMTGAYILIKGRSRVKLALWWLSRKVMINLAKVLLSFKISNITNKDHSLIKCNQPNFYIIILSTPQCFPSKALIKLGSVLKSASMGVPRFLALIYTLKDNRRDPRAH
jgi:hypothetical protein